MPEAEGVVGAIIDRIYYLWCNPSECMGCYRHKNDMFAPAALQKL